MNNLYEVRPNGQANRIDEAESVVMGYLHRYPSLKIFEGTPDPGAAGHYNQHADKIVILPESHPEFGGNREQWWRVLLHELTHSTGHPSRKHRLRPRGTHLERGFEELVAELGSTFLTEDLGMTSPRSMHERYLDYYVRDIDAQPWTVECAAVRAMEAADLILGRESKTAREFMAAAA